MGISEQVRVQLSKSLIVPKMSGTPVPSLFRQIWHLQSTWEDRNSLMGSLGRALNLGNNGNSAFCGFSKFAISKAFRILARFSAINSLTSLSGICERLSTPNTFDPQSTQRSNMRIPGTSVAGRAFAFIGFSMSRIFAKFAIKCSYSRCFTPPLGLLI